MSYDKNNSGTLSRNENKKEDKHPDHRGSAVIDGKEYWISAWIKDGRNGRFFSLSFQEKQPRHDGAGNKSPHNSGFDDGDILF